MRNFLLESHVAFRGGQGMPRANCFDILKGYYKDIGRTVIDPEDVKDTGDDYLEMELR